MPYSFDRSFDNNFARAQRDYDNQTPFDNEDDDVEAIDRDELDALEEDMAIEDFELEQDEIDDDIEW